MTLTYPMMRNLRPFDFCMLSLRLSWKFLLTRIKACFSCSRGEAQWGLAPLSQVGNLTRWGWCARQGGADERQTCCPNWVAASLNTVRPFCRLVIHLDNITAMKRSTHSAGAHASHDTNGQKLLWIIWISYGGKFLSGGDSYRGVQFSVCTRVVFTVPLEIFYLFFPGCFI